MILALDLGLNLGWAQGDAAGAVTGWTRLDSAHGDADLFAEAWCVVEGRIGIAANASPDRTCMLAYEEPPPRAPHMRSGDRAARVLYGLRAIVLAVARLNNVAVAAIPVAVAKRALTGRGRADKADMIAWAGRRFGLAADASGAEHRADALGVLLAASNRLAADRLRAKENA